MVQLHFFPFAEFVHNQRKTKRRVLYSKNENIFSAYCFNVSASVLHTHIMCVWERECVTASAFVELSWPSLPG